MNTQKLKTYTIMVIITIAGLLTVHQLDIAYPLQVTSTTRSGEMAVVGEAKVDVVPDTATINLGIAVNNAATVEAAEQGVNTINNAIIQAMRELDIPEEDIKTTNYNINPSYDFDRNREISGYNAQAAITVKTQNLDQVSAIITQATAAGANQVNGVSFSIDDPAAFREEARNLAIENAKEEAEQLSKTLGIKLGRVTNIVESGQNTPVAFSERAIASLAIEDTAIAPEIEPGSQTIQSTVTLYFEKKL